MSTPENQTPATSSTPAPSPEAPAPGIPSTPAASTPAAPRAPRRARATTTPKRVIKAAAKPAAKSSAPSTPRKPATKPQPASRAQTIKETVMSTPNQLKNQSQKVYDETYQQAEAARAKSLEFGKQFAALSLDATEKLVHTGAELYLKAVQQLPVPFVHEVAKVQSDWTIKATDLFVKQGRQLVQK